MKEIVFATNNVHKLSEVRRMVGDRFKVRSLSEIGCHDDIPETADTLEGNALIKARWVKDKDGAPGAKTARFAGEHCTPDDNVTKLLEVLQGQINRNARFSTVIALILDGRETLMEGTVHGTITTERLGTDGFGYDPVFMPEQTGLTFAQMGPDAKNVISHRGRAIARLMEVLNSYGV